MTTTPAPMPCETAPLRCTSGPHVTATPSPSAWGATHSAAPTSATTRATVSTPATPPPHLASTGPDVAPQLCLVALLLGVGVLVHRAGRGARR